MEPTNLPHTDEIHTNHPEQFTHSPKTALAPNQTTELEHIDLIEAKAEVYTNSKTSNMVDDDQLTLEEAFGLETKQDMTANINHENSQTPKDCLNILQ